MTNPFKILPVLIPCPFWSFSPHISGERHHGLIGLAALLSTKTEQREESRFCAYNLILTKQIPGVQLETPGTFRRFIQKLCTKHSCKNPMMLCTHKMNRKKKRSKRSEQSALAVYLQKEIPAWPGLFNRLLLSQF